MNKVDVVIKCLNEEGTIKKSIESAINAKKRCDACIILVDSLSTDSTLKIARKYPIRIVQLKNAADRSCGVGPQLGYLSSKGKYIYILDGDMEIDKEFIRNGLRELESDMGLAGVGGIVEEMTDTNIVFRRRKQSNKSKVIEPKYVDNLMMGGLYRKSAIDKVGYFSNPFLHSYEESDLGLRLRNAGFRLKRIPVRMVKHFGDKGSSVSITINRFKSKYLWGCGEYLRYHLWKPTFFAVTNELRIYLMVILWWFWLIISIIIYPSFPNLMHIQLSFTGIFLIMFLIKKMDLKEFCFSIFSWNMTAIGLIFGFLQKPKDIHKKIETIKIR